MFGFFKKEGQPPPFRKDGNRIHQAIRDLRDGTKTPEQAVVEALKTPPAFLVEALATTPIFVLYGEPNNVKTLAAHNANGTAYLLIFTRRDLIPALHLRTRPHIDEVLLGELSSALEGIAIGVMINAGSKDMGWLVPPGIFKSVRETSHRLAKQAIAASPWVNDGNPIHQAILGLQKAGGADYGRQLLEALTCTPVILRFAEPGKMETCASMEFKGKPHFVVFTRDDLIPPEQVMQYPHRLEVFLPRMALASNETEMNPIFDQMGLLINPGHMEVGWPVPPGVFKAVLEMVDVLFGAIKEGGLYHVRGKKKFSVLKVLKVDSEGVHIRQYSNQFLPPPFHVDEGELYLAGQNHGPDEDAGIRHAPVNKFSFIAWRPVLIQQSTVSEEELEGYRKWLESGVGYKLPESRSERASSLEASIAKLRAGDEGELKTFLPTLAASTMHVLLREPEKLETCLVVEQQGVLFVAAFTTAPAAEMWRGNGYVYPAEILMADLCLMIDNDEMGMTVNPGHTLYNFPFLPPAFKHFRDTIVNVRAKVKEGGLYYVRNPEDGSYGVLKVLKQDEGGVHLRQYSNQYPTPPAAVDEATLYILGMERRPEEKLGMGHLPISKKSFVGWKATFFQQSSVSQVELEGYKMWLDAKGGYF